MHNFENNHSKVEYTNKAKSIDMYSKEYEYIKTYNSVIEAYNEFKQLGDCTNKANFYSRVKQSCDIDCIAFGFRWRRYGEKYNVLKTNMQIHRCNNCGIKISSNAKLCKKCYDKQRSLESIKIKKYEKSKNIIEYKCDNCGAQINKGSKLCRKCYDKQRCESIPDKETLQSLISEHSYEAIGRMYNVTGKAVRKWCDKYNLVKSKGRDSSGVTCIELNVHFKTFKEAAEYLVNNCYSTATNIDRLAYDISQAKKNGKFVRGFHWI